MKIAILGLSGSGKSTLAKQLGSFYHAPVLHLDAVHFLPGWVERVPGEEEQLVTSFLDTHSSWVMDGNYTKTCYARRLEEADQIIVLAFNRFLCLWRVIRRWWATGALCGIPPRPAVWKRSMPNLSGGSCIRAAPLPGWPDTGRLPGNTPKNLFLSKIPGSLHDF